MQPSHLFARLAIALVCLSLVLSLAPVHAESQPALLMDINPGVSSSSPYSYVSLAKGVVFVAADGANGREVWRTDGTADTTSLLKDIKSQEADGIDSDTILDPQAVSNGVLYFAASDADHGNELWRTDGSPEGTWLVEDILAGKDGSSPKWITNVNGTIFFFASDGVHGWELYKTDGTSEGTKFVKEVVPGSTGLEDTNLKAAALGNKLIFVANDFKAATFTLWRSDGTAAGTVPFFGPYALSYCCFTTDLVRFMKVVNGLVYLNLNIQNYSPYYADRLWVTDGTTAGTKVIKSAPASSSYTPYSPYDVISIGNTLYFVATDVDGNANAVNFGLWKLPVGSQEATQIIGPTDQMALLTPINEKQFVYWRYNVSTEKYGLWISDGTSAGSNICPDCFQDLYNQPVRMFSKVYFFTIAAIQDDITLWETDGTRAGTQLLANTASWNPYNVDPYYMAAFNNRLYFSGDDGIHGAEPWLYEIQMNNKVYLSILRK